MSKEMTEEVEVPETQNADDAEIRDTDIVLTVRIALQKGHRIGLMTTHNPRRDEVLPLRQEVELRQRGGRQGEVRRVRLARSGELALLLHALAEGELRHHTRQPHEGRGIRKEREMKCKTGYFKRSFFVCKGQVRAAMSEEWSSAMDYLVKKYGNCKVQMRATDDLYGTECFAIATFKGVGRAKVLDNGTIEWLDGEPPDA